MMGLRLGVGVNFRPRFRTSSSALVSFSSDKLITIDFLLDPSLVTIRGPEIVGVRYFWVFVHGKEIQNAADWR